MSRLRLLTVVALAFVMLAVIAAPALATRAAPGSGRGGGPIIYVTGQGLFFDSVVVADDVPNQGPFQELEMGGPNPSTLQTEFGPGDQGYVGGRWFIDMDGDHLPSDGDKFFVCPLLGPGRIAP